MGLTLLLLAVQSLNDLFHQLSAGRFVSGHLFVWTTFTRGAYLSSFWLESHTVCCEYPWSPEDEASCGQLLHDPVLVPPSGQNVY